MRYEVYGQYSCEPAFITQEQMEYLAEKIVSGKALTIPDRKLLYTALTGDPDPNPLFLNRSGPKKQHERDRKLAEDVEEMMLQKMKLKDIIPVLGKKYNLPGQEKVSRDTFNKALKNGRIELAIERKKQHRRKARYEFFQKIGKIECK
ncbi:MAG: hypothetical protein PHD01_12990 [Geobacteraceae bacterium]|nr:hypothetical protein [Geobacteraceae bacterium]